MRLVGTGRLLCEKGFGRVGRLMNEAVANSSNCSGGEKARVGHR